MLGLKLDERDYFNPEKGYESNELERLLDKASIVGKERKSLYEFINEVGLSKEQLVEHMSGREKNVDNLIYVEDNLLVWAEQVRPYLSEIDRLRFVCSMRDI